MSSPTKAGMPETGIVKTRLATRRDVAAIAAIANWYALNSAANFASTPEPLEQWIHAWESEHARLPWFIALRPEGDDRPATVEGAGEVIGFAKASPYKTRCAYGWAVEVTVYLDGSFHGMRIGKMLYEQLLNVVRRLNYCTAMAGITMPNEASERLHKSVGFRQVALFERIGWKFGRWHDVSFWELDLRDPARLDLPPEPLRTMAQIGL